MVSNDLASARCISRMTGRTFAARLRVGGDGFLRRPCGLCDLPAPQLHGEPWCARASRLRAERLPLGLEAEPVRGTVLLGREHPDVPFDQQERSKLLSRETWCGREETNFLHPSY